MSPYVFSSRFHSPRRANDVPPSPLAVVYDPPYITAAKGDIVRFKFNPKSESLSVLRVFVVLSPQLEPTLSFPLQTTPSPNQPSRTLVEGRPVDSTPICESPLRYSSSSRRDDFRLTSFQLSFVVSADPSPLTSLELSQPLTSSLGIPRSPSSDTAGKVSSFAPSLDSSLEVALTSFFVFCRSRNRQLPLRATWTYGLRHQPRQRWASVTS